MNRIYFSLCALLLMTNQAYPGTVLGNGGATEITQIANNIQLIGIELRNAQQVAAQLQSLSDMLKNSQGLSWANWNNAQQDLLQLTQIIQQSQSVANTFANVDTDFRNRFNDYDDYYNARANNQPFYSQKYRSWTRSNNAAIKATLKTANLQYNQFATEETAITTLENLSKTSAGRMQAIQVGNLIASSQVRQMQKLRALMAQQIHMQGSFMASQTDESALQNGRKKRFYDDGQHPIIGDGRGF